ncbi:MAG: HYR domain-containing protein [Bacteroidota bacterium]
MRKFFTLKCLLFAFVLILTGAKVSGQSTHLVISQVYGGGGNTGAPVAPYQNDFIEIYNPTGATVNLTNWSVQYASSTGTTWTVTTLSGSIGPGKYYLVREAAGAGAGVPLPTADAIGNISMAAGAGKVILSSSNVAFTGACPTGASLIDLVGYGSGTNCSETSVTGTLTNAAAAIRKNNGCTDTDNNGSDFSVLTPSPRNSVSAASFCTTVATIVATGVTTSTATSGGNAITDGGNAITARGVVWDLATAPTAVLATKTSDGTGTSAFTSTLTSLAANTKYFYRAYITNSVSTSYGAEFNFTTLSNPPVVGTGSNPSVNGFTANWTAPTGNGAAAYNYTLEVDDDNAFGSIDISQSGIPSSTVSFAVTGLSSSTTYYYRVKAINTTGSSAYSATSAGTQTLAAVTPAFTLVSPPGGIAFGNICVNSTSPGVSFTIDASNLNGTNITIAAIPGLSFSEASVGPYSSTLSFSAAGTFSGKQIFVKFNPTNAQSYDGNIIVSGGGASNLSVPVSATGINTIPSVVTLAPIVTGTAATLSGSISATGCSAVSSFGFEYSTTTGFANGSGISVTASGLNSGSFSKTVSGLTAGVTYYYHALAVNNGGTGYGAQQSFTTSAVTPVIMSAQPLLRYTENFNDIANWSNNFITGIGATRFSSVAVNSTGTIPDGIKITVSSATFQTNTTSTGVQRGTNNIVMLATGGAGAENSNAVAFEFYMDFTGVDAGTLSFDWAEITNGGGNRNGSLRVYASIDGVSFTEIPAANVLNITNNVPATGTVNNIALPAFFNNSPTARLRFYYHNGTGNNGSQTLNRPKISIDNLIVTGVASAPCATPSAAPTSLTFGTVTETSIQGNFVAASPAPNEYLVIMSTNSALTSNPVDGQSYVEGDNVGDGTVIAKGSSLNFTATNLTGATTYYFFVFPVNSVCTGGPKYLTANVLSDDATTVAGLQNCTAPLSQAIDLALTVATNTIQGSFTSTVADEYLVLQSTSATLSNMPVNGTVYNAGGVLGNATVIQRNSTNTFTASGLNPATQYYYYIFSINSLACLNGPVYNTVSPLSGAATTEPLPACVTPSSQPSNLSLHSSNTSITATFTPAGNGYNYLVVMSSSPSLSAVPADNTDYAAGNGLGGGTVISNGISTSFIASGLNNSTTYYFFVFSANKNCTGGTKYLVTSPLTDNATTTNTPPVVNNYYFGTLHSHTDYSDGNKDNIGHTPLDAFNYASASLGMDFLGVSEHNHFSSLDNPGNEVANYHLGMAQAATFNSSHTNFLALYGMEWGVISGGGHVVVYGDGLTELFGWESNVNGNVGPNYDVYVPKSTYLGVEGLFKKVNDYIAKNAFATLAHPNSSDYNNLSNIPYDASADDAISGVAVESGPATSSNITYSNPGASMFYLWYYNKLLSKGYHLGPTIDHDNHNTTFGRTTAARTAVIAPSLTQGDIIKGVRDMHFYATEDYNTKVDFTINTRIMGSIFEDTNAPSIEVNVTDATPAVTNNTLIRVMFGIPGSGILPVVIDSVFATSLSYVDNSLANHTTGYYYIDITNEGKRTVTSPIWYTRSCSSSSDITVTACDSYNWSGTIYTTSTVATKVFTTVGGCDSIVTLHLTVNSSPLAATIALVGPDTVCPGSGVALTATADGSISSYEWFQDGNAVATTATGNFTALTSGGYSVKATNLNNCSVVSANIISVTVADNVAPVPDMATLADLTSQCSVTVTTAPTATDNCAGTITATTADALEYNTQGTFTIHWIYNDGNGNIVTQEQTVIVADTEKPTIVAPGKYGVVNTPGQCGRTLTSIGAPVTSDNCGVASVTNDHPSTFYPVGTTIVTWTVTDIHGNVNDTAKQIITVIDNELPTISVTNLSVSNDPGTCGANIVLATPVTNDNCGVASVTNNHPSTLFPVGTTAVVWTVTDNNGWTKTATQTITVTDTEKPTIVAPGKYGVVNTPGQCGRTLTSIGTPVTSDNCGVASVTNDHPSTFYPVGTTIVTWTVTDIHGNVNDTAKQIITVIDNELPTISVTNLSVSNDPGTCGANIVLATPVTNDNCGVASVTNNHPSTLFPVGTTAVTWTVTDNKGWTNTATQNVTVVDAQAPTVTTEPLTIYLNAAGTATITASQINNGSTDNCGISSYSVNKTDFNCSNLGANIVILTVTDVNGNSASANATVTVKDNLAPVITSVASQTFCSGSSSYTVPILTAADNCSVVSVSYAISGATTRAGNGNDASGSFNSGVSTINWTAKDASGNTSTSSTTVTVNALPAATITVSNADAFCNKITLTAGSGGTGATYKWMSGSSTFATTQQVSLGQTNGDGVYQLYVTVGACTSAAATYNFQKQNLVSSYTILAFDKVDLGANNIVASGSVGVTSNSGEAEFGSNSSVSSAGSFVKAKKIDKNGSGITISNPIYSAATGITLPTMLLNTANTNGLPNKDVAQNSVSTVSGNYKNLTLKKGSRTTLTGNTFGTIRVEQGAQVTFMASVINIDNLNVVKGPRNGYSYVRFAGDAKIVVSASVTIGSQVYINPDNNNVTFYMGDNKSDEEKFTVTGGDTKVAANIYVPNGTLKVTGGYRYGDYGNGFGDADRDDDEDRYYGQGSAYVNMTGVFIAEKIEGNGKNVIWNSFDCSAAPVPVLNTITQVTNAVTKEGSAVTSEEELKVTVMPNPSTTYFTLKIESKYAEPVNLRVMDSRGRVVDTRSKLGSNSTIQIGRSYASGTYYAEMIQGGLRRMVQLIKQK